MVEGVGRLDGLPAGFKRPTKLVNLVFQQDQADAPDHVAALDGDAVADLAVGLVLVALDGGVATAKGRLGLADLEEDGIQIEPGRGVDDQREPPIGQIEANAVAAIRRSGSGWR